MGTQYGPYVMYILSQLLQKRQAMEQAQTISQAMEQTQTISQAMEPVQTTSQAMGQAQIEERVSEKTEAVTAENDYFDRDETGAVWHKENNMELLQSFCREGVAQAKRHGHFIIGIRGEMNFIGIPGRFLIEDQPAGGKTGFTLWQPLKGGEAHYKTLEDIDEETAGAVYGYWIAELDGKTLQIREV